MTLPRPGVWAAGIRACRWRRAPRRRDDRARARWRLRGGARRWPRADLQPGGVRPASRAARDVRREPRLAAPDVHTGRSGRARLEWRAPLPGTRGGRELRPRRRRAARGADLRRRRRGALGDRQARVSGGGRAALRPHFERHADRVRVGGRRRRVQPLARGGLDRPAGARDGALHAGRVERRQRRHEPRGGHARARRRHERLHPDRGAGRDGAAHGARRRRRELPPWLHLRCVGLADD